MKVLLVEDEEKISFDIERALTNNKYVVEKSFDGEDAHFKAYTENYDAIILDLGLPKMDGLTVLKKLREDDIHIPVLVLTARGNWSDKVEGIDAGADDYLSKPFQMEELLARVRSIIRRDKGHVKTRLSYGPVLLDTRSTNVSIEGVPINLSALEYRLLNYFMHNQNKVLSRTELSEHLYHQDAEYDSNTIEVLVGRLRRKMGVNLIKTKRGLGYKFGDQ